MGQPVYKIGGLTRFEPRLLHAMSGVADGSMSFRYVATPGEAIENRQRFLETLQRLPGGWPLFMMGNGISMRGAFDPPLKPGEEIRVVGRGEMQSGIWEAESEIRAEALVTAEAGIFLLLTVADCYPVVLYDPVLNVLALAHVSRATAFSRRDEATLIPPLLDRLVDILQDRFEVRPAELVAAIGPGISRVSYIRPVLPFTVDEREHAFIMPAADGNIQIDLVGAARRVLGARGLLAANVFIANLDTVAAALPDGSRQFFSHRRSIKAGEPEGRGAFVAGMPIGVP